MTHCTIAGLDARVLLAQANIAEVIHGEGCDDYHHLLMDAYLAAQNTGYHDGRAGRSMPAMFRDDEVLTRAWHNGYAAGEEAEQIASCHGCRNGAGAPCSTHG